MSADIIEFPTDQVEIITAHARKRGIERTDGCVLILPVIKIERPTDDEVMQASRQALGRHRRRRKGLLAQAMEEARPKMVRRLKETIRAEIERGDLAPGS